MLTIAGGIVLAVVILIGAVWLLVAIADGVRSRSDPSSHVRPREEW